MKTETIKTTAQLEEAVADYEQLDTNDFYREVLGLESVKDREAFIYAELAYQKEAKKDHAELLKIVTLREDYVKARELSNILIAIGEARSDLYSFLAQLERV